MSEKKFSHTVATSGTQIRIWESAKVSHPTLEKTFDMLKSRGWEIQIDQSVDSLISDNYFQGKKGDLLFKSHRYPAGFEIEFYQEINKVNQNGGYYDFRKLQLMPYLIRCRFLVEMKYISRFLISEGYKDSSEPTYKLAFDDVMHRIKSSIHYKEGKELPEFDVSHSNGKDKNGKQMRNGEVKYFRDRKGRLQRGTVYYNLNNMWWVILNKYSFTNVASFYFFDLGKGEVPKRKIYSKEIPERIRAQKVRQKFKALGFNYSMLNEEHITYLRLLIVKELEHFNDDDEMEMRLKSQRKKDIKVLKRTGLNYASILVSSNYFEGREAITFNEGGFIGFAGWASNCNLTPFIDAFDKWVEWFEKVNEQAA